MRKIILVAAILLTACGTSESAIQTAIAETQQANPTVTFTPSKTPTSTRTTTPTRTSTPSKTPTRTATPTLEPLTATAQAKNDQATALAAGITSTAQQKIFHITATARVKSELATKIAGYSPIDLRDFLTYPDNHLGKKVVVRGRIFNIVGDVVQIYVRNYDAIYVEMSVPVSGIYEDDYITVYGVVYGSYCFTNTLGNQTCQPALFDAWYEKK